MKIRTRETLLDLLDKDSSWRKKELTNIKFSLEKASIGYEDYHVRSAIALSYAHWEGFVKSSSEYFFIFLSSQGLKGKDISIHLKKAFLQIKAINSGETKNFDNFSCFFEFYENSFSEESLYWDHKKIVSTKSNLKFDVFSSIAKKIGVELSHYDKKQLKIDSLVNHRNSIAHGERTQIGVDEAIEYVDLVKLLLEEFKTDVANIVTTDGFRKLNR